MVADRDQRAAVARTHQICHQQIAHHQIGQHHVEILLVAAKRVAEDRERIGAGRHRSAGEPVGAREEIEQNILRGQRRDDEIEPLQPRRRHAEDQADQSRDHAGQRDRKEYRDRQRVGDIGRGESAEQKECGVADRDLASIANQNVQAKGGDGKDADLDQRAEPVGAEHQRCKANQRDAKNGHVAAGCGRKDRGVGRIGGAVVAGGNQGRACHELHPLDVFGAEQTVGLDHENNDQHVERRDFIEIAPVQIFAVDILRDVFQ